MWGNYHSGVVTENLTKVLSSCLPHWHFGWNHVVDQKRLTNSSKEEATSPILCVLQSFIVPQALCLLLLRNIWFRTGIELTSGKSFEWIQAWESLIVLWLGLHESLWGWNCFNYLCLICFLWNGTVCMRSVILLNNASAILFTLVLHFLWRYTSSFTLPLGLTTPCSFSHELWERFSQPRRTDSSQFVGVSMSPGEMNLDLCNRRWI